MHTRIAQVFGGQILNNLMNCFYLSIKSVPEYFGTRRSPIFYPSISDKYQNFAPPKMLYSIICTYDYGEQALYKIYNDIYCSHDPTNTRQS